MNTIMLISMCSHWYALKHWYEDINSSCGCPPFFFFFLSIAIMILKLELVSLLLLTVIVCKDIFHYSLCDLHVWNTFTQCRIVLIISGGYRGHFITSFFIIVFLRLSMLVPLVAEPSGEIIYFNCYALFLYGMLSSLLCVLSWRKGI